VTFGDVLPDGIDALFAACHDPLVISTADFLPRGSCEDGTGLTTPGGMAAYAAVYQAPAVNMSGAFPSDLEAVLDSVYTWLPFEFDFRTKECELSLDLQMTVRGMALQDAETTWLEADGKPALNLHLEAPSSSTLFALGNLLSEVSCPSDFNLPFELLMNAFLPNGPHHILLEDVSLDVRFSFAHTGRDVTVRAGSDFDFSAVSLSPDLPATITNAVGTFEDILGAQTGITAESLKSGINTSIAGAVTLAGLVSRLESLVEDAVPTGHSICSLTISNAKLIMATSRFCLPAVTPIPL
jgi:hypothetical protein